MTTSTKLDRSGMAMLREEINEALREVGERHGLEIRAENGSYALDCRNGHFKVTLAQRAADGTVITEQAKDFTRMAESYGLQPTDLGRAFTVRGERYRVTGLSKWSPRFPILATRERDERGFKFPAATVVVALGLEPKV